MSLLGVLRVSVTPIYAAQQGTDGSELQVVKAEQPESRLGITRRKKNPHFFAVIIQISIEKRNSICYNVTERTETGDFTCRRDGAGTDSDRLA